MKVAAENHIHAHFWYGWGNLGLDQAFTYDSFRFQCFLCLNVLNLSSSLLETQEIIAMQHDMEIPTKPGRNMT